MLKESNPKPCCATTQGHRRTCPTTLAAQAGRGAGQQEQHVPQRASCTPASPTSCRGFGRRRYNEGAALPPQPPSTHHPEAPHRTKTVRWSHPHPPPPTHLLPRLWLQRRDKEQVGLLPHRQAVGLTHRQHGGKGGAHPRLLRHLSHSCLADVLTLQGWGEGEGGQGGQGAGSGGVGWGARVVWGGVPEGSAALGGAGVCIGSTDPLTRAHLLHQPCGHLPDPPTLRPPAAPALWASSRPPSLAGGPSAPAPPAPPSAR